jgi:hypothetical protein
MRPAPSLYNARCEMGITSFAMAARGEVASSRVQRVVICGRSAAMAGRACLLRGILVTYDSCAGTLAKSRLFLDHPNAPLPTTPHVAAPSSPLLPPFCTLTGCLFTLYHEHATTVHRVAIIPSLSDPHAAATGMRRPNFALAILPLYPTTTLSAANVGLIAK